MFNRSRLLLYCLCNLFYTSVQSAAPFFHHAKKKRGWRGAFPTQYAGQVRAEGAGSHRFGRASPISNKMTFNGMPTWLWRVTSGNGRNVDTVLWQQALFGQALHNTTRTETQNDKILFSILQSIGIWTCQRISIILAAHQWPLTYLLHGAESFLRS